MSAKKINLVLIFFVLVSMVFLKFHNFSVQAYNSWCMDYGWSCGGCPMGCADNCVEPLCVTLCYGWTEDVGTQRLGAYWGNCGGCFNECGCVWPMCLGLTPTPGCFVSDTNIETSDGQKAIEQLKVGEQVKSQEPVTGKEATSIVEKIYEVTSDAYYKIRLKNGTEVKVTAEHPLFGIPKAKVDISFWQYLKTESLTRKMIDYIEKFLSSNF